MSTRRLTIKSEQKDGPSIGMRLFDLMRLLLSRRRFIAAVTAGSLIVTATAVLLISNEYTSVATILPTGKSDKMAELKALAGLTSSMSTDANSSDLFPSVLQSQAVRDAVLKRTYRFTHDGKPVSVMLSSYYDITNKDKLRAELAANTGVSKDRKTGLITVSFTSQYPELSRQVVQTYLDENGDQAVANYGLYQVNEDMTDFVAVGSYDGSTGTVEFDN